MSARRRRTTLSTIAVSAGVSVATVSKVLNGRSDVAPATRSLVRSLLEQHDYVPSSARRTGDTTIEIQVDDMCAYFAGIVGGTVEAGADSGVSVAIAIKKGPAGGGTAWARDLVSAGRQAVITIAEHPTPAQLAILSRARLPVVVIDPLDLADTSVSSVGPTNFTGGLLATRHLLALGHSRIAYLGGLATALSSQARLHGYRAAMEDAGVPVLPEYIRTPGFCYPHGVEGAGVLLDLRPAPTAIFAASDECAVGAIHAAKARGLRVPEDLSIVGFDDSEIASMTSPKLTTMRQPLRQMGIVALRTALRLAAGERIESAHVELATELVIRESSLAA